MLLSCSILVLLFISSVRCDCIVSPYDELKIYDNPKDQKSQKIYRPVYLDRELNFLYPSRRAPNELRFSWFQDRLVYCPGGEVQVGGTSYPLRAATPHPLPPVIRCIDQVNNRAVFELESAGHARGTIDEFTCSKQLENKDWLDSQSCANGKLINLGFELSPGQKKSVIQACYNDFSGTSIWASAIIRQGIKGNRPVRRSEWTKGMLFQGIAIKIYYEACTQVDTFIEIFKDKFLVAPPATGRPLTEKEKQDWEAEIRAEGEKYVFKYIRKIGDKKATPPYNRNYFVKGHLIANSDMYYIAEQYSTFYYANALPMWDSINNGNWKSMEEKLLELASQKGDLKVWVGGVGVLALENKEIWLGRRKKQTQPVMPVPKVIFKLVYCSETNEGMAFVAINNPYVEDSQMHSYGLCQEYTKCRQLEPKFNKKEYGVLYCCLVADFLNVPQVQALQLPAMHEIPGDVAPII